MQFLGGIVGGLVIWGGIWITALAHSAEQALEGDQKNTINLVRAQFKKRLKNKQNLSSKEKKQISFKVAFLNELLSTQRTHADTLSAIKNESYAALETCERQIEDYENRLKLYGNKKCSVRPESDDLSDDCRWINNLQQTIAELSQSAAENWLRTWTLAEVLNLPDQAELARGIPSFRESEIDSNDAVLAHQSSERLGSSFALDGGIIITPGALSSTRSNSGPAIDRRLPKELINFENEN